MRLTTTCLTVLVLSLLAPALIASDTLDGYWKAVFRNTDGDGSREYYFDLTQDGGVLRGRVISPRGGEYPIQRGSIAAGRVKIEVEREYEGTPVALSVQGKRTAAGRVAGSLVVAENEVATFVMERLGNPVGRWRVAAKSPDEQQVFESVLTLGKTEKGYSGAFESDLGRLELGGCAWKDDRLVIELALPTDEGEAPIRISVAFDGADTMKGKWSAEETEYSGGWHATRDVVYELTGLWELRADTPEGEHAAEIEISRKGEALVGRYTGQFGELVLDSVRRDGNRVAIEMKAPVEGESMTIALSGEFGAANSLVGEWQARDGGYEGAWKAVRRPSVSTRYVGEWKGTVTLPSGEEAPLSLVVETKGGKLAAKLDAPTGKYDPRRVRDEDGRLRFEIVHVEDGEEVDVYLEGKLTDSGAIEGVWEAQDERGEWRATKAAAKNTAPETAPKSGEGAKVRI